MSLIAVVCWITLAPTHAAEGVVTYKSLAPDVAFDLARSALQQCRKDGYQVAVVVTDRFGAPLAELRDRYTPVGALDIAKGKAWTAVTFTRDTGDLAKAMKDGTISAGLAGVPGVAPLVGGVVIEAGGSLLGAVGVAGAPGGDKDETCAKAGLAACRTSSNFSEGRRQASFDESATAFVAALLLSAYLRRGAKVDHLHRWQSSPRSCASMSSASPFDRQAYREDHDHRDHRSDPRRSGYHPGTRRRENHADNLDQRMVL